MIKIYNNRNRIPKSMELIEFNDIFFNSITSQKINVEKARKIIYEIDECELISKFKIKSKFDQEILNIDQISTGCKTALNIYFNIDKIFSIKECGENAIKTIFDFDEGSIFSDYAIIPIEFTTVLIYRNNKFDRIDNYQILKEWWENEK